MSRLGRKVRLAIATTRGPSVVAGFSFDEEARRSQIVRYDESHIAHGADEEHFHGFDERLRAELRRRGYPLPREPLVFEVDGGVDAGASWQVGLAAAYLLWSAGRLALDGEPADGAVLATGRLGTSGWRARGVEGVAEKAARGAAFLAEAAPERRLFVLPAENAGEAAGCAIEDLGRLAAVLGVRRARPRRRLAPRVAAGIALAAL
ncbi:MAG: hypothetical protein ACFBWO_03270, partial [Paracoccaceae bacterium]